MLTTRMMRCLVPAAMGESTGVFKDLRIIEISAVAAITMGAVFGEGACAVLAAALFVVC